MNEKETILAVDDMGETLTLLDILLTQAGYHIQTVESGESALTSVTINPPDLILLDIYLKDMDGLEVCRRLKESDGTRHIPIILVSAFADTKKWITGLQLGAADYITKPFQPDELLARVKTHLALSRAHIALAQQAEALRQANERLQAEIAECRILEAELRESEDKFKYFFDNSVFGMSTTLPSGEVNANRAYCQMLGYTQEEIKHRKWQELSHHDDVEESLKIVASLLSGENDSKRFTKRYLHKNGSVIWADVGTSLRRDINGNPQYFITTVNDISERKQAEEEKEKLKSQLQQAQKMESVGRLAGGVAHDFNNMLSVILGFTEVALDQTAPSQPLHDDLEEIRRAAERSADLTRQLLAFARKQTIFPKELDLNQTVEGILKMLRRLIGEDIHLSWFPGTGLWPINMDPSQIDQMLANLCVNARDAIVGVGKIDIETSIAAFDEAYCAEHSGFVPGEYVLLSVKDNGCGMDQETSANIFEPFFTTKTFGESVGLGLATVYGIVKQNNGFIDVRSEQGQGTTFAIYLPRHISESGRQRIEETKTDVMSGRETVLLLEDEPAVLKMTIRMLEMLGYTVLSARTPRRAIDLVREHQGNIDLLITDVIMPEMNGRDLAKVLLSMSPNLKCLFMSGYTANVIASQGILEGELHFIKKPFTAKNLATKIREVLAQ